MRKQLLSAGVFAAFLFATACTSAEQKAILILVSNFNLSAAKGECRETPDDRECKSVKDPRELGRRLEESIMDQLAVTARCSGVTAFIEGDPEYDGKRNEAALQAEEHNPYWNLRLFYRARYPVYDWELFAENPRAKKEWLHARPISGKGTVAEIAEQVCIAIKGQGANVR
jgi:hypothetical protein